MGRKSVGRSVYETMPSMTHCKEVAMWWALNDDEKLAHTRSLIDKAYSLPATGIYQLTFLLSAEEAIQVFQKSAEIERIMCDGEDFSGTFHFCKHNYLIAKHYTRLGNKTEALRHLELANCAAGAFDKRPEERKTYSLLLGERLDKRIDFETADTRPLSQILRKDWLSNKAFDCIRDSVEFAELFARQNNKGCS